MQAHAHDLRAEVGQDWGLMVEAEADRVVRLVASDWRRAPLGAAEKALCAYAEKLTLRPSEMTEEDIAALRAQGFNDRGIHDATQVIAYFNYINRVADGLHVEEEDFIRDWGEG